MDEFNIILDFKLVGSDEYIGNIVLHNSDKIIQDDELTEIRLSNNQLTFYIPNKNTSFEGTFNHELTELTGDFLFPDGMRHAIQLSRRDDQDLEEKYIEAKAHRYDKDQLIEDVDFLYTSLQDHHPRLYEYTPKESFDSHVSMLKPSIDSTLTLDEFYSLAAKVTDMVKCSHTGVRPPEEYRRLMSESGYFFPWKLFFVNGKAYYISGASASDEIAPGTEVVSINKIKVESLLNRLACFVPVEEGNETTVDYEFNHNFNELYSYLDGSKKFEIGYERGGQIDRTVVPGVKGAEMDLDIVDDEKREEVSFYYLENEEVAALHVSTFGIENMEGYFEKLDFIFREINTRNTKHLVLDLRGNRGGHPIYAAQLLSYLVERDFIYFKRNEDVLDFEPLYNVMKPNELNYNGHLYVLIDGGCLSTTGHLISLLKYHTDAVFIGEEPGSSFRCNDFSVQRSLPNTRIEVNIPRTTFEAAVDGAAASSPFPVDHRVSYTVEDIIMKQDPYLEVLKDVIREEP